MGNIMIMANDGNIRIERLELGPWGTNAYIIVHLPTGSSVVLDAPADAAAIIGSLESSKPGRILMTHSHMDHTGALTELRSRLGVPVGVHADDAGGLPCSPDFLLNDGDVLPLGAAKIEVLHTPGHTAGSLCFRIGRYLLSGDTIFPGGPGKTGSPADFKRIVKSIEDKILVLPDDTEIFPGHGEGTVLRKEKAEFAVFKSRNHAPGLCGDVLWLSS